MAATAMTAVSGDDLTVDSMEPVRADRERTRILLVEDDLEMRRMLAAVLTADGFDVTEARNGADGVDYLLASWGFGKGQRTHFDLIISDIRMPGWTGLEILEIVRCTRARMPVILITAFGAAEIHAQARRLRASATIDKPFDLDVLRSTVRKLVTP
jgi:DNA-binding response OmpR family regulator